MHCRGPEVDSGCCFRGLLSRRDAPSFFKCARYRTLLFDLSRWFDIYIRFCADDGSNETGSGVFHTLRSHLWFFFHQKSFHNKPGRLWTYAAKALSLSPFQYGSEPTPLPPPPWSCTFETNRWTFILGPRFHFSLKMFRLRIHNANGEIRYKTYVLYVRRATTSRLMYRCMTKMDYVVFILRTYKMIYDSLHTLWSDRKVTQMKFSIIEVIFKTCKYRYVDRTFLF